MAVIPNTVTQTFSVSSPFALTAPNVDAKRVITNIIISNSGSNPTPRNVTFQVYTGTVGQFRTLLNTSIGSQQSLVLGADSFKWVETGGMVSTYLQITTDSPDANPLYIAVTYTDIT